MKKFFAGILLSMLIYALPSLAQNTSQPDSIQKDKVAPNGWDLMDRATTGYYGISLDKAYDLLKGRKSKPVVVAVIDSGVDTLQEDLKPVLWHNPGEIPHNGIDDDHNGYTDDYYGWNFLGNKDGKYVTKDSYEAARVYWNLKSKYGDSLPDTARLTGEARDQAVVFLKAKAAVMDGLDQIEFTMMKRLLPILENGDSLIARDLGKKEFNGHDLANYSSSDPKANIARSIYMNIEKLNNNQDITNVEILEDLRGQIRKADAASAPPPDYRGDIVKDDYNNFNDRYYGNSDVTSGTPTHGTHCSGIIAAVRNNGIGMNGIADNVRIMMIRAVPDGDEHDKDIALAIRYAVDNGAKIISMSFGKSFSPQKNWVDDAVRYAAAHDVLLVHAAGNDAKNIDSADNFPTPVFLGDKDTARNFITVGASGDPTNGGITASFSNYGKKLVDVFAPGVNIYSTLPGKNSFGNLSGTSMATPVVAGVAALLLEYFPDLTAVQLKQIIVNSVASVEQKVTLPGTRDNDPEMVNFSDLCVSGGIVNAYNAVKLAMETKGEKKK